MAHSTISKTARLTTLVLSDLSDNNSLTLPGLMGDFSCNIPGETINVHKTNGLFASTVGGTPDLSLGEETEITFSFSCHLRDISSASYATMLEACLGPSGLINSGWSSTLGANHNVKTLRLKVLIDGSPFGEGDIGLRFRYCNFRATLTQAVTGWTFSIAGTDYEPYPEYVTS